MILKAQLVSLVDEKYLPLRYSSFAVRISDED